MGEKTSKALITNEAQKIRVSSIEIKFNKDTLWYFKRLIFLLDSDPNNMIIVHENNRIEIQIKNFKIQEKFKKMFLLSSSPNVNNINDLEEYYFLTYLLNQKQPSRTKIGDKILEFKMSNHMNNSIRSDMTLKEIKNNENEQINFSFEVAYNNFVFLDDFKKIFSEIKDTLNSSNNINNSKMQTVEYFEFFILENQSIENNIIFLNSRYYFDTKIEKLIRQKFKKPVIVWALYKNVKTIKFLESNRDVFLSEITKFVSDRSSQIKETKNIGTSLEVENLVDKKAIKLYKSFYKEWDQRIQELIEKIKSVYIIIKKSDYSDVIKINFNSIFVETAYILSQKTVRYKIVLAVTSILRSSIQAIVNIMLNSKNMSEHTHVKTLKDLYSLGGAENLLKNWESGDLNKSDEEFLNQWVKIFEVIWRIYNPNSSLTSDNITELFDRIKHFENEMNLIVHKRLFNASEKPFFGNYISVLSNLCSLFIEFNRNNVV